MTIRSLTLSVRGLREGTRNRVSYAMRGILIAVLCLAVYTAEQISRSATMAGTALLWWVIWSDWILIGMLSISAFSAVITEEKELMSLGLLRLAGFTPVSIVLGKSLGMLSNALLLLVVQVPFCVLSVTLGGVTFDQILAVFAMLGAYTLFGYGLALFCSVITRRNSTAASLTGLILLAYHVLPFLIRGIMYRIYDGVPVGMGATINSFLVACWETSACAGLVTTLSIRGSFGTTNFADQILVNLALAAVFFALSWVLFERCNRNEMPPAPARGFSLPFRSKRTERPSNRSWSNALLWKDYRFLAGGVVGLGFRVVIYAGFFAVTFGIMRANLVQAGNFMMGSMLIAFLMELGLQAGRVFHDEVKEKTLGSLIALPHSLGYIAISKIAGALILTLPAAGYFLIGALLAPEFFLDAVGDVLGRIAGWYGISLVFLTLHLTVFYSVRFTRGALGMAIGTVFIGNVILTMLMMGCMFSGGGEGTFVVLTCGAFGLCYVLIHMIASRLRTLAAEG